MENQIDSKHADTKSIWAATAEMPDFCKLDKNVKADVCIIGGGISGLSTAYHLQMAGKSVVLLDDGPLCAGVTAVTTAHLSNAIDDRYLNIESWHGEMGSRLAAESHTAAISRIDAIVKKEKINCDFERVDGFLFLSPDKKEDLLFKEMAAAHRAGLVDVEKLTSAPMPSFNTGPCLRFPNQAMFHPLKYLTGMANAIHRAGGQIYTYTHATEIEGGRSAHVSAGAHRVEASAIVVATNSPINDLVAIHTKQTAYMTYAIGIRVPKGSVTHALYWDTGMPYHYIRLQKDGRSNKSEILIVGGEDHRTGQATDTRERFQRLEKWTRERFPMVEEVEFTWSGQVMETIDGLAFIGHNPMDKDNVYVSTGDSGMGMTHGTIAGMLLADLILGRENPWTTLYNPDRKTIKAALEYASQNLNTAAQYTDWVTPGELSSEDELGRDCGTVIRRGLSKIAIYRDNEGVLHQYSAVCPHLGGIVHWNAAEKTFDCPCHGSRFDRHGEVMNGPANTNLPLVVEHAATKK